MRLTKIGLTQPRLGDKQKEPQDTAIMLDAIIMFRVMVLLLPITTGIVFRLNFLSPSTSPKSFNRDVMKIILPDIIAEYTHNNKLWLEAPILL
jgi:hypothetical protein